MARHTARSQISQVVWKSTEDKEIMTLITPHSLHLNPLFSCCFESNCSTICAERVDIIICGIYRAPGDRFLTWLIKHSFSFKLSNNVLKISLKFCDWSYKYVSHWTLHFADFTNAICFSSAICSHMKHLVTAAWIVLNCLLFVRLL